MTVVQVFYVAVQFWRTRGSAAAATALRWEEAEHTGEVEEGAHVCQQFRGWAFASVEELGWEFSLLIYENGIKNYLRPTWRAEGCCHIILCMEPLLRV